MWAKCSARSIRPEKRIDLVVSLLELTPEANEDRQIDQDYFTILESTFPILNFVRPVDIARIVEVALTVQVPLGTILPRNSMIASSPRWREK